MSWITEDTIKSVRLMLDTPVKPDTTDAIDLLTFVMTQCRNNLIFNRSIVIPVILHLLGETASECDLLNDLLEHTNLVIQSTDSILNSLHPLTLTIRPDSVNSRNNTNIAETHLTDPLLHNTIRHDKSSSLVDDENTYSQSTGEETPQTHAETQSPTADRSAA